MLRGKISRKYVIVVYTIFIFTLLSGCSNQSEENKKEKEIEVENNQEIVENDITTDNANSVDGNETGEVTNDTQEMKETEGGNQKREVKHASITMNFNNIALAENSEAVILERGLKDDSLVPIGENNYLGNIEVNVKGEENQILMCEESFSNRL